MIYILYFIHVVVSIFLILVVLLQQGKGADLSVFGGGASQAAFGARGTASLLHKFTVAGFVMFILTTLTIGILQTGSEDSVMRGVAVEGTAEEEAAVPAADGADPDATEAPSGVPAAEAGRATATGEEAGGVEAPPGEEP